MNAREVERLKQALRRDGRYAPDAYDFLRRGLECATRAARTGESDDDPIHVTGPQLCESLRQLALQQWGLMAQAVLHGWRIYATRDFGEMVFFLVELGCMGKQASDRIEDFDAVYDFDTAFRDYDISCNPPDRTTP